MRAMSNRTRSSDPDTQPDNGSNTPPAPAPGGPTSLTDGLPITLIKLRRGNQGLGFHITGGVDNPRFPGDTGIFVTSISASGTAYADGCLQVGDKIVAINGIDMTSKTHKESVTIFVTADDEVTLFVQRGAQAHIMGEHKSKHVPVCPLMLAGAVCVVGFCVYIFK